MTAIFFSEKNINEKPSIDGYFGIMEAIKKSKYVKLNCHRQYVFSSPHFLNMLVHSQFES